MTCNSQTVVCAGMTRMISTGALVLLAIACISILANPMPMDTGKAFSPATAADPDTVPKIFQHAHSNKLESSIEEDALSRYNARRLPSQISAHHQNTLFIPHDATPPVFSSYLGLLNAVESSAAAMHHLYPEDRTRFASSSEIVQPSWPIVDYRFTQPSLTRLDKQPMSVHAEMMPEPLNSRMPLDTATRKRKSNNGMFAALKFLKHHPQLQPSLNAPIAVPESSSKAQSFRAVINENLFSNKLAWRTKSDELTKYVNREGRFRQYIQRINTRESVFAADSQTSGLDEPLLVVPHKSYVDGNVMFDPEPEGKNLLFSFWTPSTDEVYPRLQLVGSASLARNDASDVLKQASLQQNQNAESALGESTTRFLIAPLTRKRPVSTAGLYTSTKRWLSDLPLVEQLLPLNSVVRTELSENLVSALHEHAEEIKELANGVLFGGHAVWHNTPEDAMLSARTESAVGIFRYHKGSSILYLAKPETLPQLPYRVVLIPFDIRGPRAKLFDASLGGNSLTFTLWAAHDKSAGGRFPHKYFFVSGGSIRIQDTGEVLRKARITLARMMEAGLHRS